MRTDASPRHSRRTLAVAERTLSKHASKESNRDLDDVIVKEDRRYKPPRFRFEKLHTSKSKDAEAKVTTSAHRRVSQINLKQKLQLIES